MKNILTNKGKKWTVEEVNKLKRLMISNKTYEEIALEHQRTIMAVKVRVVVEIIYPLIKSGMTIEEAEKLYNIDKYDIGKYLSKCDKKNNQKKNDVKFNNEDIMHRLYNIENKIESILTIIYDIKNEFYI